MAEPTYIIYALALDLNSGGAIALHYLAQALEKRGERVRLWPMGVSPGELAAVQRGDTTGGESKAAEKVRRMGRFIARPEDLNERAIAVYPEIAIGNPLKTRNVVRWLLNKPLRLRPVFKYSPRDMFFKFSDYSDDPKITGGAPPLFIFYANPAYRDPGPVERRGSCYIVRKGADKAPVHPPDAIRLDGLPHEKVAEAFIRCERFYCYDEATLYSQYAAICGCTSIVIPGIYKTRAEWAAARPIGRYGVAFGLDDVEHARATRHLLPGHLSDLQAEGLRTVDNFIRLTRERFGFGPAAARGTAGAAAGRD